MQSSKYQLDIYAAFVESDASLLIEAVAGSGKTTVLVELARIFGERWPGRTAAFVAFNKSIAEELGARIGQEYCVECGAVVRQKWTRKEVVSEGAEDEYVLHLEESIDESAGCRHDRLATTRNVRAMTLHSAGFAAWRRAGGIEWRPKVDTGKVGGIVRELLPEWKERERYGEGVRKLVALGKQAGIVPRGLIQFHPEDKNIYAGLVPDTPESWESLMDHYSIDAEDAPVEIVRKALARDIELGREVIDFDDMLYLPVIAGVPFDRYDVVLVDEAQDVSGIQMEMIGRMSAPQLHHMVHDTEYWTKGRVIAVGDRHQAIYGFRGAGTGSMDEMQARFQMKELPLSVSYRCPQSVIEHARRWVPQIEPMPGAEDGYVGHEGTDWRGQAELAMGAPPEFDTGNWVEDCRAEGLARLMITPAHDGITKWQGIADFRPGDAVLCRLTRPLVAAAFSMIRAKVGCRVLGRDIGIGLVALTLKVARKSPEMALDDFAEALDIYQGAQRAKLAAKRKHAQIGLLEDQCQTLQVFIEMAESKAASARVEDLVREIKQLFVDDNGTQGLVILATVHKAKGLEWERVFILDASELMPWKWARKPWELEAERNIQYVAATRAMRELRYITTSDLERSTHETKAKVDSNQ